MYFHTSIFISRRDSETCKVLSLLTWNSLFPRILSVRPIIYFQNLTKIVEKSHCGAVPRISSYGAAPFPPTQVGAKCLAAVVLDNQDRALRLASWMPSTGFLRRKPRRRKYWINILPYSTHRHDIKLLVRVSPNVFFVRIHKYDDCIYFR